MDPCALTGINPQHLLLLLSGGFYNHQSYDLRLQSKERHVRSVVGRLVFGESMRVTDGAWQSSSGVCREMPGPGQGDDLW
jgi:hypothetical protein